MNRQTIRTAAAAAMRSRPVGQAKLRVVDVGCRDGVHLPVLGKIVGLVDTLEYTGLDESIDMVAEARAAHGERNDRPTRRVVFWVGNGTDELRTWPVSQTWHGTVDLVMFSGLPFNADASAELLRQGGVAIGWTVMPTEQMTSNAQLRLLKSAREDGAGLYYYIFVKA